MAEVKSYKVLSLPSRPSPDSIYWVKGSSASDVIGYITDRNGVPYPLKDLQGSGGITTLTNTDGNLVITGANSKVINIAPALLSVINSALQSGANISELVNDAGYLTTFTEIDPIFQASEASLFVVGDKANLDNQSGVNSGDETTLSIQTKRPLKTINGESLEGNGNVQINYNDLDNLPTIVNDKNYVHNQIVASNFWEIQHNLNKYPSVSIIDSGNNLVVGEIKYIDLNNIIITFTSVFSGKAYFN